MSHQHYSPNPYLEERFCIAWSQLTAKAVVPDIRLALEQAQQTVDGIANLPAESLNFKTTLLALDETLDRLNRAWTKVGHLDSVRNEADLRKAYNTVLPEVSGFFTRIHLNPGLWQVIKQFAESDQAQALEGVEQRLLEETLADFRENGAELPADQRTQLEKINAGLAQATQRYSENVLDATNAWEYVIDDESRLAGLPESAIEAARQSAREKGYGDDRPAWRFTLHAPSMMPVMQYAEDDALRKMIWEASCAVGHQEPHDNTGLIKTILTLRRDKARLLGKPHFADHVLQRRMAGRGQHALSFVETLHAKVKSAFDREVEDLRDYKAKKTGQPPESLQPWETAFWAEKQRREYFDLDEEALRPYFPVDQVMGGLFSLAETLFGITIKEKPVVYIDRKTGVETRHPPASAQAGDAVEVWHPAVRYYEVHRADGTHSGSFYTDWHPRPEKRGGAWMNYLVTGGPQPDGGFSPHLGLICGNLTPPVGNKPALLTHDEVQTVFHEFGHLLHHLLGTVAVKSLNGVNVAWDFVELPSQIMENWCWHPDGLRLFARHYDTGEPLPDVLLDRMLAARNHLSASAMMRQLSLGKMDLELHLHSDPETLEDLDSWIRERLKGYLAELKTPTPPIVRRFTHLFSSPTAYAAGYYSYKWAEVLDADAFSRFEQEGLLNPETGVAFRDTILSQGNSRPPAELFLAFMGRDPDPDALLRRSGLL